MKKFVLGVSILISGQRVYSMQIDKMQLLNTDLSSLTAPEVQAIFESACIPDFKTIADVQSLITRRSHRSMERSMVDGHFFSESDHNDRIMYQEKPADQEDTKNTLEELLPAFDLNDYNVRRGSDLFSELSLPEKRSAIKAVQNVLQLEDVKSRTHTFGNQIQSHFDYACENSVAFFNTSLGKVTALAAVGLVGASYKMQTTRGILDVAGENAFSKAIEFALGSAGGCIAFYLGWKEIARILQSARLITKMDKEFKEWILKTKALKRDIDYLSTTNKELSNTINSVVAVTKEIKQSLPSVVALSSDHDNLAGILQLVLAQLKKDQKEITKLQEYMVALAQQGALSLESQKELQEMIEENIQAGAPLSLEQQKLKIVEKYNKVGLLGKFLKNKKPTIFDQIPQEWFESHQDWLDKHHYSVRP